MKKKILNLDKELLTYIIGVTLGDGNLSNPNNRAVRLRITCDIKYPFLISKIKKSLEKLLPSNKVSIVTRPENYIDLSCYSNKLPKLLGWQPNKGSKFKQAVHIPSWIKKNKNYTINCLRGLLETDGCVYNDRGYKMVVFATIIPKLAHDIYNSIVYLNFTPNIYKLNRKNKHIMYRIRLSKNVSEFLDLIKPEKI